MNRSVQAIADALFEEGNTEFANGYSVGFGEGFLAGAAAGMQCVHEAKLKPTLTDKLHRKNYQGIAEKVLAGLNGEPT